MTYGELAKLLVAKVKEYRNSIAAQELLQELDGKRIGRAVAARVAQAVLGTCPVTIPREVREGLKKTLEEWSKSALTSIRTNSHMNNAGRSATINQDTFDALLVDFVNRACMPMDLALYTSDLKG